MSREDAIIVGGLATPLSSERISLMQRLYNLGVSMDSCGTPASIGEHDSGKTKSLQLLKSSDKAEGEKFN